jgi:hypothetical protein
MQQNAKYHIIISLDGRRKVKKDEKYATDDHLERQIH